MRYINFVEPQNEAWNDWRARCEEARDIVVQEVKDENEPVINKDLYKEMKVDVYMSYEQVFRGKCAYCERDIHNQYGDVEHYRPECGVTDIDRKPVTRQQGGQREKHPGYYWLAYEWTNLLPACEICNRPSTQFTEGRLIGKWDRFPILGDRAWEPDQERHEEPLLLNPIEDEPSEHFVFERNGTIVERNRDARGKATIKVLGLNENGLPDRLAERYNDVRNKASMFVIACKLDENGSETQKLRTQLERIKAGYGEFTTYALIAIKDERKAFAESVGEL